MSRENKFGKWGAWALAAGIAVGGGHELLSDNDSKPHVGKMENGHTVINSGEKQIPLKTENGGGGDEETGDPAEASPTEPTESTNDVNKIINIIGEMSELRKREMTKFFDQIDPQLYYKLTTEDTRQMREKILMQLRRSLNPELEGEYRKDAKKQDDLNRHNTQKGKESAVENKEFNRIKIKIEKRYPNAIVFPNQDGINAYTIEQTLYAPDKKGLVGLSTFSLKFTMEDDDFSFYLNGKQNTLSESSFFQLLNEKIMAKLLFNYFRDILYTQGIYDDIKVKEGLENLLNSYGFNKYMGLITDDEEFPPEK